MQVLGIIFFEIIYLAIQKIGVQTNRPSIFHEIEDKFPDLDRFGCFLENAALHYKKFFARKTAPITGAVAVNRNGFFYSQ